MLNARQKYKQNHFLKRSWQIYLQYSALFAVSLLSSSALAQSGLEGRITEAIGDLVRVVNVLIVGFVVWAGFLIAKGEGTGLNRLIYGIIGLIVVNTSYLIINYFA